jgi:hypothetical protein
MREITMMRLRLVGGVITTLLALAAMVAALAHGDDRYLAGDVSTAVAFLCVLLILGWLAVDGVSRMTAGGQAHAKAKSERDEASLTA